MKLFLDANILVSVLNHEMPIFTYSSRILSLPQFNSKYVLATSPICLAIAYYFAEKKCRSARALEKMRILSNQLEVVSVGPVEVNLVNTNKKINDYEDGLQYYAAINANCKAIITENLNDFHFAEIPIYSSKDFILKVL